MAIATLSALKSKDPNTKVGACIVNDLHQVLSIGYNGFPRGLRDETYPWNDKGSVLDVKYTYVVHAELNTILAAKTDLKNCTLYTTLFPCSNCAKAIIQTGIKKVIYHDTKYLDTLDSKASMRMLKESNISLLKINKITLTLKTN